MNFLNGILKSCLVMGLACGTSVYAASKPNVVIIYGDDVGFGDVGVYGSKLIPTPNIDKLAAQGLVFMDGHSTAGTCTPSRFSMLTGCYAFRNKVNILPPDAPLCILVDAFTLPKLFNQAGYETGVIGKWHLGIGRKGVKTDWNGAAKPGPLGIGFKSSYLLPATNDRVPCVYLDGHRVVNLDPNDPIYVGKSFDAVNHPGSTVYPDGKEDRAAMTYYSSSNFHDQSVINGIGRIGYMAGGKAALWNDETISDELVAKARTFIATHKHKPFFLFFASQDIHVPRTPHPRFKGKTVLGYRGDAMVQFDWSTGEILAALEEHGLTDNTIVIFSSDNGPTYDDGYQDGTSVVSSSQEVDRGHDATGIWRGGKGQIYEGGNRVPFIIRWPERIKPGISNAMVNQIDLMASFASFFEMELPAGAAMDSRNTWAAFLGNDPEGLAQMLTETRFRKALRHKQWKYIAAGRARKDKGAPPEAQLFNLADDPGEQKNVIQLHPEVAEEMEQQIKAIIAADGIRDLYR